MDHLSLNREGPQPVLGNVEGFKGCHNTPHEDTHGIREGDGHAIGGVAFIECRQQGLPFLRRVDSGLQRYHLGGGHSGRTCYPFSESADHR